MDAATLIPSQKTIESLLNFSVKKKIERLIPRLSKVIDNLNEAAPEPMRHVYLSSVASNDKLSRLAIDTQDDQDSALRPLAFVPQQSDDVCSTNTLQHEANENENDLQPASVFDQSVLVDLNEHFLNTSEPEPLANKSKNGAKNEDLKENDVSFELELAKLEESVLGDKSSSLQLEVSSDVKNPFKASNLKRKSESTDALKKKKKV